MTSAPFLDKVGPDRGSTSAWRSQPSRERRDRTADEVGRWRRRPRWTTQPPQGCRDREPFSLHGGDVPAVVSGPSITDEVTLRSSRSRSAVRRRNSGRSRAISQRSSVLRPSARAMWASVRCCWSTRAALSQEFRQVPARLSKYLLPWVSSHKGTVKLQVSVLRKAALTGCGGFARARTRTGQSAARGLTPRTCACGRQYRILGHGARTRSPASSIRPPPRRSARSGWDNHRRSRPRRVGRSRRVH